MSPTVKKPARRLSSVYYLSPLYSKSAEPSFM
jgi:hypothetical protein